MSNPPDAVVAGANAPGRTDLLRRSVKAFGRFWWDFLIGDTPELFAAMLAILGITAVLVKVIDVSWAWAVMPVLVAGAITLSVLRGSSGD